MRHPLRLSLALSVLLTFLTTLSSSLSPSTPENGQNTPRLTPRTSKPFPLRIMPLGASLTVGYQSSDGNGYRKPLRDQLRYAGWEVDMVGSSKNGTMKDNDNEGHFAYTIDQVAAAASRSVDMQPNLILINAGTNDALQSLSITTAASRMSALLSSLFAAIPNTTIILSTLLPNGPASDAVDRISRELRGLVARRRSQGDKLVLAEMSYFITAERLVDGIHPDDEGYREMAAVWWAAVREAEREEFLSRPSEEGLEGTGEGEDDGVVEDPRLPVYVAPRQMGGRGSNGGVCSGVGKGRGVVIGMLGFVVLIWL
ncbi:SGNH hydrolase-type esterase domain-containing protein [Aspergillus egyptiacus]|nr:SGNH hydrolase-type esterase domain-containing protein [Aspergillus egyptiacus]